jgi:hypothetical protein
VSTGRRIDVRKQRNLTVRETFALCVKGILHRLLRSVLTLAVVLLAVAFFMFLISESVLVSAVGRRASKEVSERRFGAQLLNHLFNRQSEVALSRRLAGSLPSAEKIEEYVAVSGWSPEKVRSLAENCRQEQLYLDFFENMPVGKRLILVRKRKGREIFRALTDPDEMAGFAEKIKPMLDLSLPGEMKGFTAFLGNYRAHEAELAAFGAAWNSAIENFVKASSGMTGEESIESWLRAADAEQLAEWGRLVVSRGFNLADEQAAVAQEQIRNATVKQEIMNKLGTAEKRDEWRKTFKERKSLSTDEKMFRLNDQRVVGLLDNEYSMEQLAGVSLLAAEEKRLAGFERALSGKVDDRGEGGNLSGRQFFLLIISFVVCMVGIANAMLMSITERFREIATMKCLGATDRYILIQFMMEAVLQGFAGGILGMLIGFVIALGKNSLSFGSYVFARWPWQDLCVSGAVSLAAGILLAVLASIYPSWAASRMVPMEAMRVE